MRKRTIPVMLYLSAEENEQLNYDLHRTGLKKSQYLRALITRITLTSAAATQLIINPAAFMPFRTNNVKTS